MVKRLLSAVLMLMAVVPLAAQPSSEGRGLITTVEPTDTGVCSAMPCLNIAEWLYPSLFAVDPLTGVVVPPDESNFGLVENIVLTGETTQQLILRDDLYWRDGQPVTAYDVLFNLITFRDDTASGVTISSKIKAVTVQDSYTLLVEFTEPDCALPGQINFLVLPAHVLLYNFKAKVDAFIAENSAPRTFDEWLHKGVIQVNSGDILPQLQAVSAGAFIAEPPRPNEPYRLISGETAVVVRSLNSLTPRVAGTLPVNIGPVEAFMAGELSYLINPPLNRRADLIAKSGVQIAVEPSERWALLMFNFADPDKPRDAFDAEGNPRDQGVNPLVGDPAVRQAIRLAIDVEEIIDTVYQGYAEPLASLWPPTSWAHDADRPVAEYDFRAAADILQAAGWWDADRDGVRECRECSTATIGTPLTIEMIADDTLSQAGQMIARQLSRIGINVAFINSPAAQRFDLYLMASRTSWLSDPDLSRWFTRAYDRRNAGIAAPNYGSYYDETVERLFTEARTVDSCAVSVRRDLYHRIQDELDTQTAVIPLFVEQDMIVAQPFILGFDPLPARPLWNIRDWVVMP